jgi:hypothetical protein
MTVLLTIASAACFLRRHPKERSLHERRPLCGGRTAIIWAGHVYLIFPMLQSSNSKEVNAPPKISESIDSSAGQTKLAISNLISGFGALRSETEKFVPVSVTYSGLGLVTFLSLRSPHLVIDVCHTRSSSALVVSPQVKTIRDPEFNRSTSRQT